MTWRAILFPKFKAKGTHPVRQIFFNLLCSFKDRVAARLYVQRAISPNILQKFKKPSWPILNMTTRLTSTRKRNRHQISSMKQTNFGTGLIILHTILKNQSYLGYLSCKKTIPLEKPFIPKKTDGSPKRVVCWKKVTWNCLFNFGAIGTSVSQ